MDIQQPPFIQFRRVEFQTADHLYGIRAATQFSQLRRISLILRSDSSKGGEKLSEHETEQPVTRIGSFRQTRIDQESWDPLVPRAPKEVGPNLRFDQDDGLGADGVQRMRGDAAEIQWDSRSC